MLLAESGKYDELSDQMKWVNWESQKEGVFYCSALKSDQVTDYINPIKLVQNFLRRVCHLIRVLNAQLWVMNL